ncbi:MAG: SGNH/GDSL hydrolase family protein [Proteobacteria bacterium]|nr:SGNH/GDSL hydrolase family protein [Pseudomonadota bacterium]
MVGRVALVIGSILFSLIVLELGVRAVDREQGGWHALLHWPNLVVQARTLDWASGPNSRAVPDTRLGFVGRPNYASSDGALHYDAHSFRVTPAPDGTVLADMALKGPPILVVGDSYAHGDEVRDAETWPAHLQALLHRRVVNAAMSGYGIDQMVLRAAMVAPDVKPAAIVLSFIADDARRAEMKRVWGAEKPWFELVNGQLVERNVPVPPSPPPASTLDIWQRLFGWSRLLDTVLESQGWKYEWQVDYARVLPRGTGVKLACPLFERLAGIGVPALVVAEYDPYHWQNDDYRKITRATDDAILACARAAGLATLDLFPTIDAAVREKGLWKIYGRSHPGPAGTELAAHRIAEEVQRLHMPPR